MKLALLFLGVAACGAEPRTVEPAPPKAEPSKTSEVDARFVEAIRAAAPAYASWGRVDERPRPAPTDCRFVTSTEGTASQVRMSKAGEGPHGDKLYFLWASDRARYLARAPVPRGFAIVKQSFRAEPAAGDANAAPRADDYLAPPPPITAVTVDGKRLQVGAPTGLYVMTKVGDGPGTDAGWIYGTIAPDGTVTSAGRVGTCMRCHEDATHERLFGLTDAPGA